MKRDTAGARDRRVPDSYRWSARPWRRSASGARRQWRARCSGCDDVGLAGARLAGTQAIGEVPIDRPIRGVQEPGMQIDSGHAFGEWPAGCEFEPGSLQCSNDVAALSLARAGNGDVRIAAARGPTS